MALSGISGKAERAEHGPQVSFAWVDPAGEQLDNGLGAVESIGLVLMERRDTHVVTELSGSLGGFKLPQNELQESGFSAAVGSDKCDGFGHVRRSATHLTRLVCRRSQQWRCETPRRPVTTEAAPGTRIGPPVPCGQGPDHLQFLEGLDAALHLAGFGGLVTEPIDEPLHLGYLTGLVRGGGFYPRQAFLAGDHRTQRNRPRTRAQCLRLAPLLGRRWRR